jgi:hypothetical protein
MSFWTLQGGTWVQGSTVLSAIETVVLLLLGRPHRRKTEIRFGKRLMLLNWLVIMFSSCLSLPTRRSSVGDHRSRGLWRCHQCSNSSTAARRQAEKQEHILSAATAVAATTRLADKIR